MNLQAEIDSDCYGMAGRIEGRQVADVGASNGVFTRWALGHGAASVDAYEPDPDLYRLLAEVPNVTAHQLAVTADGTARVVPHGFGMRVEPEGIRVPAVRWVDVLTDVVKADCEGCEYDLIGLDLSMVEYIGLEFHMWGTPDDPVEGFGFRGYQQTVFPTDLHAWLAQTHDVTVVGGLETGGYMHGVRR